MPNISLDAVAPLIRKMAREYPVATKRGLWSAALRAADPGGGGGGIMAQVIADTKPFPPVGVTGAYRASWGSEQTPDGARVFTDIPYAAFIEIGTRPHWLGWNTEAGRALRLWAARKFGVDDGERVAFFVRRKIAARGTAPRWVAQRATPIIGKAAIEEVLHEIEAAA